jgi:hypothetical protein
VAYTVDNYHLTFIQAAVDTESTEALFSGGLTGAFVVLSAMSLLSRSDITLLRRVLKALFWSPVGGVLSVVGWMLGPSLGMLVWSLIHHLGFTNPIETLRGVLYGQPLVVAVSCLADGNGLSVGMDIAESSRLSQESTF